MSSPSFSTQKAKNHGVLLTMPKRLLLIFLACCIQMIYIPTSNRVQGGIEPKLPIDIFPVSSMWVLPYLFCYLLWLASFVWILLKKDDLAFRAFIAACMLTFGLGALTFLFFPTYVPPAVIDGDNIFANSLRAIHENWGRYAALPSGHVYITTLLALFFSRWYPHYRPIWIVSLLIISLSTLFTAQHYILDVIGGYLVALVGYYFGLWWAGFHQAQNQTRKRSGKRIPSSSLN